MFIVVGVVGYTNCGYSWLARVHESLMYDVFMMNVAGCGYSTGMPEFMMYDVCMMNVAGCGCEWAPGQLGRGAGSHG